MSELLDSAPDDVQPTQGGARPKPHAGTNDRPEQAHRAAARPRHCAGDGAGTRARWSISVSGLFQVPSAKRRRLIRAADPMAVERIIEAVLKRPHRDPLGPFRDAALVAAMGFTVAARPSEWLVSATWRDVHEGTVELQAVQNELGHEPDAEVGRKTGARVSLLLPNAYDRLVAYRRALEARYGKQPDNGLVFQECSKGGAALVRGRLPGRVVAGSLQALDGPRVATSARGGGAPTSAPRRARSARRCSARRGG